MIADCLRDISSKMEQLEPGEEGVLQGLVITEGMESSVAVKLFAMTVVIAVIGYAAASQCLIIWGWTMAWVETGALPDIAEVLLGWTREVNVRALLNLPSRAVAGWELRSAS